MEKIFNYAILKYKMESWDKIMAEKPAGKSHENFPVSWGNI